MRISKISCLSADVVIGFGGSFCGDEFFLMSLKVMLKLWEDTRKKKYLSQVMVTMKGRFKG